MRDQNRRVAIHTFAGDRERLRPLFRRSADSDPVIDRYLLTGAVLTAVADGDCVGHLQLVDAHADGVVELKSMAVVENYQGKGVGRALVEEAALRSRARGARLLIVATAAADTGNLRFYQRL